MNVMQQNESCNRLIENIVVYYFSITYISANVHKRQICLHILAVSMLWMPGNSQEAVDNEQTTAKPLLKQCEKTSKLIS